jgi:hypothetical protein
MHYTLIIMADQVEVFNLLKETHLFRKMTESELVELSGQFEQVHYSDKQIIFKQRSKVDFFYVVLTGKVYISRPDKKDNPLVAVLVPGDSLGEGTGSYNRPRSVTAIAYGDTVLLRLPIKKFLALARKNKEIAANLTVEIFSHRLSRQVRLRFLNKDEVVYLMQRKHSFFLWLRIIPWLLFLLIGLLVLLAISASARFLAPYTLTCTAVWAVILLVITAWNGIDWSNDYYIVTNERVIWLEKVLLIYDSRQEAPLSTVLSVNVNTDLWGRMLGYGDVIIRTYTGTIPLHRIAHPFQVASMVEEYWGRSKVEYLTQESEEMEKSIRRRLGLLPPEPKPVPKGDQGTASKDKVKKTYKGALWQDLFANFFRVRFEDKDVVTYRKHWFVLLQKIWMPTFLLLIFTALLVARMIGYMDIISFGAFFGVDLVFWLGVFGWWFYNYWDWRNDIYQVTPDQILDIEKKPLGREVKKSAPLDNILSIDYERLGLIGLILNYGAVNINIGATKFVFHSVFDPSQVQQDIFRRMAQRVANKKKQEALETRERFSEWIASYHRNVEDLHEKQNPPEEEQN